MKSSVKRVIDKYDGDKGALISVLQEVQQEEGYLSSDTIREVALGLGIPLGKVFGVATFYSQFRLSPIGKNIIRVCMGTACHVGGGKRILETIENELKIKDGETTPDGRFTLESVACIGACGLAPVMMVNDETYGRLTPDTIHDILSRY